MIWPVASPCPASVTPMVSRSARFAWVTALKGSCSYGVSAIRRASCSVIAIGRSLPSINCGVGICYVFLDLHQWVLERVLLFESPLQVGQPSLLEEVEEFLAVMLLPGHDSKSPTGSGSLAPRRRYPHM